jgi:hypothetical protein
MLKASAILAALALLPTQDTGAQFYKFTKGTVWKYKATTPDSKDDKLRIETTGEDDGKVTAIFELSGERGKKSVLRWWVEDGYLFWGEKHGEKLGEIMGLYKVGSKKGDTWKLDAKDGRQGQEGRHEGLEEVKVPAGVYKDAVHIKVKVLPESVAISFYLVEKVGLVKISFNEGDKLSELLLEEFVPAK